MKMQMQKPADLETARTLEAESFSTASKLLAEDLVFVEQIANLYKRIQGHYTKLGATIKSITPEEAVLLQAVMSCRHLLVRGVLTLLRGQLGDSFGHLRKSAEFTLFAARVLEKEGTAIKWLNAAVSAQHWNDYKDSFKINNMTHMIPSRREKEWTNLKDDLPKLNLVIDNTYDEASKRLHATVLAAGPEHRPDGLTFFDGYVDQRIMVEPKNIVEPYFFTLWRHLDIADVHAQVLLKRSSKDFNEAVWLADFDPLEQKIESRILWWRQKTEEN